MKAQALLDTIEQLKFELGFILFLAAVALLLPAASAVNSLIRPSRAAANSNVSRAYAHARLDADQPEPNHAPVAAAPVTTVSRQAETKTIWPLRGRVTAGYGVPHYPWQPRHTGIDIASGQRSGTAAIKAFRSGVVVDTPVHGTGLGRHVVIDHGDGLVSYYGHLASTSVRRGQNVKAGDIIGREGRSGTTTGPHLHFEIRRHDQPINPYSEFPE